MAAFGKFNLPEWGMILSGALVALVGMATGHSYPRRPDGGGQ